MVLPSSMRIKGHRCFGHLHRTGVKFHSHSMLLRVAKARPKIMKGTYRDSESKTCRCAVVISAKVSKKAVIRNRLRRLIHNHLRLRLESTPQKISSWALLTIKPSNMPKNIAPLLEECDKLLRDAGLIS
ncbi:ribonuclease P protein component [Prochlorococcus sp. MIT 1300]|uniref:ribonuclease P protein component n=1 Tax=Prochlorococcus sp. MIT 1300 TaxID=3096218 RepID=UPI002A74AD7C|nr:ribonuclease P protein component [Prochlorococcus sp. MIT 1300]